MLDIIIIYACIILALNFICFFSYHVLRTEIEMIRGLYISINIITIIIFITVHFIS